MAFPPPPSYPGSVSMSRSRTSADEIRSVADAMLRSSLSRNASSMSSTATATQYPNPPHSHAKERSTPWSSSTTSRRVSVGPDSSMTRGDIPAAAMHLASSGSSTSATTSRTRERLRLAELERDELRRAVEKERAVAERLKREGRAAELPASEAQHRFSQLKRDLCAAGAELPQRSTAGLFKKVCSTDLLFLIDTTGSMYGYINAAKEQVKSIVKNIEVAFFNEAEVRIAVVGYKDHSDTPNIQFLDFTPSADRVRLFLSELTATGGDDTPEDVLGGIRQALNATWMQQTRCIIHIADAPPHGRTLQNFPVSDDSYPNPGSEPHSLTYEPLLRQMVQLNINYALLRINNSTDRMAFNFSQVYAAASADCTLHKSNKFYNQAREMFVDFRSYLRARGNSKRSAKVGLLFEEAELGTAYNTLRHLVVKIVTTSASLTAVRVSALAARTGKKQLYPNLTAIKEDEDDADDVPLENIPPQWDNPGWFNETLMVEGFSPDVGMHVASTLNDMMAHNDNIKMSITELTIHKRSRPFAQGAMRVASYARTAASTNRFVVKSFKKSGKRLAHVAEDMQAQALCKAFALEFNALSEEEHAIDFIVTTCLKGKGKSGTASGDDCMSLEPFIDGNYVKYSSNCGYVNRDTPDDRFNEVAQAFSHFTFERSRGSFLVSDLQGVSHVLTDPAIHTLDPERFKLSDTNLGMDGVKLFFATHECTSVCKKLRLKSNGSMILSGRYEFREIWPSMDNTVCCSNKLCGRIVRLVSSAKSEKFPGYHWCDVCWPQLHSSMVNWICVAPGPHHEFEVSEFFYESQGQSAPRKCPKHREQVTMTRTAVVGGSLWARLKFATRKKSESGKRLRKGGGSAVSTGVVRDMSTA